ncbi:hypothetical protein AruPA_07730 [Acidiphilium sp. PA]|uniref:hypothetical protein n=1 Tax=Acidiphilium sp. PA TaxID=2871705 RepID=UPI002243949E|nr:hypothetical protein [Acidiphilium sp. PA]MCW8306924.1 hypothetical protein [Acidiphilium sp. PA]
MNRNPNRQGQAIRRILVLAGLAGALGVATAGTASADPPWQHDGGWHGRPGWHHGGDDDWRGGYRGPRGYYPPPPPVYYAPPPPPPPPVYYAPPPPAYYGPPTLSFGINVPIGH